MNRYSRINHQSEVPKYKQVVDMIISDIESGYSDRGSAFRRSTKPRRKLLLSRDTVEKAYVS
jgi:DNA-binding transcriptional MocR family regulator